MTDYKKWEHTDSDFTFEELADTLARRLAWDAQVDQWKKEGHWEWNNHRPFDPTSTEAVF